VAHGPITIINFHVDSLTEVRTHPDGRAIGFGTINNDAQLTLFLGLTDDDADEVIETVVGKLRELQDRIRRPKLTSLHGGMSVGEPDPDLAGS
jgi:hypothetical protein